MFLLLALGAGLFVGFLGLGSLFVGLLGRSFLGRSLFYGFLGGSFLSGSFLSGSFLYGGLGLLGAFLLAGLRLDGAHLHEDEYENEGKEGSHATYEHDDEALGRILLVGHRSLVEPELVAGFLTEVDFALGTEGLHLGKFFAFEGDHLALLGVELLDFGFELVADAIHDLKGVLGAVFVDATADAVVLDGHEVGDVAGKLGIDVGYAYLDAEILGTLDGDVAAIGLVGLMETMGIGRIDAIVGGEVELVAHVGLHGLGEENLEGILAVALGAIVEIVHAVAVGSNGLREAVGRGGEQDYGRLVAGGNEIGGCEGERAGCYKYDSHPFPPTEDKHLRSEEFFALGGHVVVVSHKVLCYF